MNEIFRTRFFDSHSGNRKSKACPELRRRIENRKWLGLSIIAFVLLVCGAVAQAQQPGKMPKIGFLSSGPVTRPWRASFQREFQKLGYVEGRNVTFIHRFAD